MKEVLNIVKDKSLTYQQQELALARLAENLDHTIKLPRSYYLAKKEGIICDLNEGNLPYRPRYICPDYEILFKNGCKFLNLEAPKNLDEAISSLLIMYHHVPSITSFPVYLGRVDKYLEPFTKGLTREEVKNKLRLYLRHIDSCLTDSFVHLDIGPEASMVGELIMELSIEMNCAVPNVTLLYDEEITPDDFALKAVESMLKCAKPSFANHKMFQRELGNYAIASCYNGLYLQGGGYTLPRLKLYECSLKATSIDDFLKRVLPKYIKLVGKYMEQRIIFLNEESSFFTAPSFLLEEGFISKDRFVGMFGVVGLCECVNHLMGISDPHLGFGNNEECNKLGVKIMDRLEKLVFKLKAPYSKESKGHYLLHAQVGIDTDNRNDSPGTRIKIGYEPPIYDQLRVNEMFHHYFPSGTGDIFNFDETWINNKEAVLDIIKGSLNNGLRYFSGYLKNNDVVRVTGYLVKRSEIEKLNQGKCSLNQVTVFGKGADDRADALKRRLQK